MTSHHPVIQSQSPHYRIMIWLPEELADLITCYILPVQSCSQWPPCCSSHLSAFALAILCCKHSSPRYLQDAYSHFFQSLLKSHLKREVGLP